MSKKKIATAVAAVSVLLILSLIFFRGSIIPKAEKHELDELLSSKAGGVDVLISTEVKVGDRVARYTLELSEGSSMINRDTGNNIPFAPYHAI